MLIDITFFENSPFYTKNSLQGEHIQEDNFWDPITPVASIFPSIPTETNLTTPESINTDEELPIGEESQQQQQLELCVYSRQNNPRRVESTMTLEQGQEFDSEFEPGMRLDTLPSLLVIDDRHLTIVGRKRVCSCTQHPISYYVLYDHLSTASRTLIANLAEIEVPNNIEAAMRSPEWKQAVIDEILALEKNGMWELVDKPKDKRPVGCKWVFIVKYNSNRTVERYKSQLVAKGFTQTYGIDYQETFVLVAKLNTIRILLSIAANFDWKLQQLDIKNAFLNSDLEEEVYMELPPGFNEDKNLGKVCRLKKIPLWAKTIFASLV